MTTPLNTLRALYHVYNGETYDYARKANKAFDERIRAANAVASLLTDRAALSEAEPADKTSKYSARMSQIALEASHIAKAHQNFEFNQSVAAAVTPSREQLGENLIVNPAEVNAQARVYSGPPEL